MAGRKIVRRRTTLQTSFALVDRGVFAGHVFDPRRPDQRFVVELYLDGLPVSVARADDPVEHMPIGQSGHPSCSFLFAVPESALAGRQTAEAWLANQDIAVGEPISLDPLNETVEDAATELVSWLGGLRFEGSCGPGNEPKTIMALVDGEVAAEAETNSWIHVPGADGGKAERRFDLHLPMRFADGRARRVRFVRQDGQDLTRKPLTFVAYPEGLATSMPDVGSDLDQSLPDPDQSLRDELVNRLVRMSMPFSQYPEWRVRYAAKTETPPASSVAVVLIGDGASRDSLASLERQAGMEWVAAVLSPDSASAKFDADELTDFIENQAASRQLIVFALAGTRFADGALSRLALAAAETPDAVVIYGDIEIQSQGTPTPIAFPVFDYERMLEQGYCGHLFALRRSAVTKALRGGATDIYRLFNIQIDADGPAGRILHVPWVLGTLPSFDLRSASRVLAGATEAHLKARGRRATIAIARGEKLPAIHVRHAIAKGATTIVIPVRDQLALLRSCLRSIAPAVKAARADIMIVDNGSSDGEMLDFLDHLDGRQAVVLRVPGPFNFSQLNNLAANKAHSEYLCLLNNDVEALDNEWLPELLRRISEPDVGAVGALLLWPSGVVQHGGVVLDPSFGALHAFNDRVHHDSGYGDLLRVAHQCSSVTAACMLTRRKEFLAVGGMDEVRFPINFNDVDYCLKLRARNKRIVFTPHARLKHLESASRGRDHRADRAGRFAREVQMLRSRWGEVLREDPYYSPLLSLDSVPFSALAWPPRTLTPRSASPPIPVDIPPGF
jgi:GT2 family glycosyltransferase